MALVADSKGCEALMRVPDLFALEWEELGADAGGVELSRETLLSLCTNASHDGAAEGVGRT